MDWLRIKNAVVFLGLITIGGQNCNVFNGLIERSGLFWISWNDCKHRNVLFFSVFDYTNRIVIYFLDWYWRLNCNVFLGLIGEGWIVMYFLDWAEGWIAMYFLYWLVKVEFWCISWIDWLRLNWNVFLGLIGEGWIVMYFLYWLVKVELWCISWIDWWRLNCNVFLGLILKAEL